MAAGPADRSCGAVRGLRLGQVVGRRARVGTSGLVTAGWRHAPAVQGQPEPHPVARVPVRTPVPGVRGASARLGVRPVVRSPAESEWSLVCVT